MLLINFSLISIILNNGGGLIMSFFITIVAAAEAALGLTIIVLFFKLRGSILIKNINNLK